MIGKILATGGLAVLGGVCLIVIPIIIVRNGFLNMRFSRKDFIEKDGELYRKEK